MTENKPLTNDQRSKAVGKIKEIISHLSFVGELLKKDQLSEDMLSSLSLTESFISDLSEIIGYDGVIKKQLEQRYKDIRQKNQLIRELEAKIGSELSVDGAPELLKSLSKEMNGFWRGLGLSSVYDSPRGTIGNGGFSSYGVYSATLMIGNFELKKELKDLDLIQEEGAINKNYYLLDTDKNKEFLKEKLEIRFPSLEIQEWKTTRRYISGRHFYKTNTEMVLYSLYVEIDDLKDLKGFKVQ